METNEFLELLAAAAVREVAAGRWRARMADATEAEEKEIRRIGVTEDDIRAGRRELMRVVRVLREDPSRAGDDAAA